MLGGGRVKNSMRCWSSGARVSTRIVILILTVSLIAAVVLTSGSCWVVVVVGMSVAWLRMMTAVVPTTAGAPIVTTKMAAIATVLSVTVGAIRTSLRVGVSVALLRLMTPIVTTKSP
jgi:hypothetical protein